MKTLTAMFAVALFAVAGPAVAASESPMAVDGTTVVDAVKAKTLFDKGTLFVDVRSDKDWAAGRIPDAVHIELKSAFNDAALGEHVAKVDEVVIYCNGASCMRSSEAAAQAASWGYSQVYYFRDGFPAWKDAGYPVE